MLHDLSIKNLEYNGVVLRLPKFQFYFTRQMLFCEFIQLFSCFLTSNEV